MVNDIKQIAKTLVEHQDGKSDAEAKQIVKDVVSFMVENNLLEKWRDLEVAIHDAWKEKYGVSTVKIVTAHELSSEARKVLQEIASGADLIEKVDERLIGGAVIRIDDKRIDGSIAGSLRRLKTKLYG